MFEALRTVAAFYFRADKQVPAGLPVCLLFLFRAQLPAIVLYALEQALCAAIESTRVGTVKHHRHSKLGLI